MNDRRNEFIINLYGGTYLGFKTAKELVGLIPDKDLDKAIAVYREHGIYDLFSFVQGLKRKL